MNLLSKIKEWLFKQNFLSESSIMKDSEKSIFYHEDDFCQIEFLPDVNIEFVKQEIENVETFLIVYQVPNELMWAEMNMRDSGKTTLEQLGITIKLLKSNLEENTEIVEKVLTGYSTYTTPCINTIAFKIAENNEIFVRFNNNDVITRMWAIWRVSDESAKLQIINTLNKIPSKESLVLADRAWDVCVKLNDAKSMNQYFYYKYLDKELSKNNSY